MDRPTSADVALKIAVMLSRHEPPLIAGALDSCIAYGSCAESVYLELDDCAFRITVTTCPPAPRIVSPAPPMVHSMKANGNAPKDETKGLVKKALEESFSAGPTRVPVSLAREHVNAYLKGEISADEARQKIASLGDLSAAERKNIDGILQRANLQTAPE